MPTRSNLFQDVVASIHRHMGGDAHFEESAMLLTVAAVAFAVVPIRLFRPLFAAHCAVSLHRRRLMASEGRASEKIRVALNGGASEKIRVALNGATQGMFITGMGPGRPVLLFVHGFGIPEYWLTRRYPFHIEELFTVAWWEQRGSGPVV